MSERLGELTTASDQQRQEYETALNQTETRLREVTSQYHQLRGMRAAVAGRTGAKAKTKASASNDAVADETKVKTKALGKRV
ncbi:MAG TPA: hypothetical protein PLD88_08595 [Candidatus Berkiella sp.]|nr:hypothetical protein [Candidatus Berkiella sp.]